MAKIPARILCGLMSGCLAPVASAKATHFDLRDAGGRNLVQFVSEGTLDKTVGSSSALGGWVEVDPEHVAETLRAELETDVRTFSTNDAGRDLQMREKLFNAAEFPLAQFTVTKVVSVAQDKMADGVPLSLQLEGALKFRGTLKSQTVLAKITYFKESELTRKRLPGNLLKVEGSLDLDVTAFIPTPFELGPGRWARYLQVSVDALGSDQSPAYAPVLIEGLKPKDPTVKRMP